MAGTTTRTNVTFIRGSVSSGGALTETVIQLGAAPPSGTYFPPVKFILRRVKIMRTAGTAASFTPLVTSATPAVSLSTDRVWLGANTLVAALCDENPDPVAYGQTDADGRVYLVIGWDAGADNAANYELDFEILA